jgi:hypothetical protein
MDFSIVVEQATALRTFSDIISSVLRQVHFNVTPHNGGVCLYVDTVEENHVCMVQGRLACGGFLASNVADAGFCIDAKTLQNILKSIAKHHAVHIGRRRGESCVELRSVDELTNKVGLYFKINTLDVESESLDMGELDYNYEAEVDLNVLKVMFGMAKDVGCDRIGVTMMYERGSEDKMYLRITGTGTSVEFVRMISCNASDGGSAEDICTDKAQQRLLVGTEAHFTLDYLVKVLSKMDQQYVTVRMGNDLPMLMRCNLGVEDSFAHFVIAPKITDA